MVKVDALYCPECKLATLQKHPQADNHKDTKFNYYYKCNFCAFCIDITTHHENIEKKLRKED